jgi:carboxylesterase type B
MNKSINIKLNIYLILLILILLLLLSSSSSSSSYSTNDENDLQIKTSNGLISGFTFQSYGKNTIKSWLGIPYAQPPINSLRFQSPIIPTNWGNKNLICDKRKSFCIQPDGTGSEDCLYLDIYASSSNNNNNNNLPVLFYIYGGGLMSGSTEDNFIPFIDEIENYDNGVIIVQVTYRLNIFGFLASKELSKEQNGSSGNYGIQDQILALKWVQNNIKLFGGDPNLVTIAGQSSGGTSVFALISSPHTKGLYQRAISLSGSPNITMSMSNAEIQNEDIIIKSGCSNEFNSSNEVVKCLRKLSVEFLISLIPESWNTPGIWNLPSDNKGMNFSGLLIVDGDTITHSLEESLSIPINDIPFMVGNMKYEPDRWPEENVSNLLLEEWKLYLDNSFSSWPGNVSNDIFKMYIADSVDNPQKSFDDIVTDYGIYCPMIYIANYSLYPNGNYKNKWYSFVNNW